MTPIQAASTSGHARFHHGPCARLRPCCGPSAVPIPTNIPEPPRIPPRSPQRLHGFSLVFAAIRGPTEYRGARIETRIKTGDSGPLRRICGGHTALMPGVLPAQTRRMPCLTDVCLRWLGVVGVCWCLPNARRFLMYVRREIHGCERRADGGIAGPYKGVQTGHLRACPPST